MIKSLKKRKVEKAKKLVEDTEQSFIDNEIASRKKYKDIDEAMIRLRIR